MTEAFRGLTQPKLDDESWRELRRLVSRHGYEALLRALKVQQMIDILDPSSNILPEAEPHDDDTDPD